MSLRPNKNTGVSYDASYVLGGNWSDVISATGTVSTSGSKTLTDQNAKSTVGNDRLAGGNGDDTIYAGAGNDELWGDSFSNSDANDNGQDRLFGQEGNDLIHGGNGKDYLEGGDQNDTLYGDNGTDTLVGGLNADDLYGGNADDTFVYNSFEESRSTLGGFWNRADVAASAAAAAATGDWIRDFQTGSDKLDLTALNAQLMPVGSAPSKLTFYDSAHSYGVWITTDATGTYVNADRDGNTTADLTIRVTGAITGADIVGINHGPDAKDDSVTTAEDMAINVSVLANDVDTDLDSLTVSAVTQGAHGTVTINANGTVTYTPAANYNGPDSFTYTVTDPFGGTDTATVSITVTAVNDAPVAQPGSATGLEDAVAITGSVVATDVDNAAGDLIYSVVSGVTAAQGVLTFNPDGSYSFVPAHDFNGPVSFSYKASDGALFSNTATVSITVTAVNDAPVANPDSYTTAEDTAVTIAATGVLANDTDIEGSALNSVLVTGPTHGSLTLNANGSFTYTPNANYNGGDSFTYRANDGSLSGNTTTVSLTVTAVPDAAVITGNGLGTVTEDLGPSVASGMLAVTDPDGPATFNPQTNVVGTYGSFSIDASGNWTYNLNNADPDTNALNNGDIRHDVFAVISNDGTPSSVDVTVNGHSDQVVANIKFVPNAQEFPSGNVTSTTTIGQFVAYDAFGAAIAGAQFSDTLVSGNVRVDDNGFLIADSLSPTNVFVFTISSGGLTEDVRFQLGSNGGGDAFASGTNEIDIFLGLGGGDTISGGDNDDTLYGGNDGDTLNGGLKDDFLIGGSGADTLNGDAGSDYLRGGADKDTMTGGSGADTFAWLTATDSYGTQGQNRLPDTITDFVSGSDKLDLSAIDANTTNAVNTNDAFTFFSDGVFHAHGIWTTTSGGVTTVFADTDGAAGAEFQIQLTNGAIPLAGDFIP